jgi:hypothetical protein
MAKREDNDEGDCFLTVFFIFGPKLPDGDRCYAADHEGGPTQFLSATQSHGNAVE